VLLNNILKRDWGFDGVVISDWGGCHSTEEAIVNGLDLEFGTWTDGLTMGKTNAYDSYYLAEAYKRLIREGRYTTKELDEKVRRVLRLFYRTTMNRRKPVGFLCSDSHYEAALKIAQEGIVLLKNSPVPASNRKGGEPLLPIDLTKTKRILVVGENAIKMMTVGGGSSSLKVQKEILPLDGIRQIVNSKSSDCEIEYARGYVGDTVQSYNGVTVGRSLYEIRSAEELRAEAVEKARQADVVIMFGGLNKSDYQDCEGHDRKQFELPYGQNELVEALVAANPRLVYVNISGNAVAMPWISKVPAVVQGWFIGSEAGEALASVLVGDVNPSGKLPFTWYASLDQCGAHATGSYPGTWRTDPSGGDLKEAIIDEEYKEDIFVGYRWIDKMESQKPKAKGQKPLFPFGYGLSYTTFELKNLRADKQEMTTDGQLTFTVDVTNTGNCAGSEVVQLYISDVQASVPRPVKELKGFSKVFLQPGETRAVSITIDSGALSFYDDQAGRWTAEPGEFEATVAQDGGGLTAKSQKLKAKFVLR
jgi:beta-glucosidase